ncbi:MAG: formylglycine-generating enzyme family protein [Chitinophagaceae bacterium]|nr:formylglycine-generating enzyme family protein [Chitinophagaceae bacterium]
MESKNFTITQIGDIVLKQPMPFIFIEAKGKTFLFQEDDKSGFMDIDMEPKSIQFKNNFYLCAYPCTQEFWQAVVSQTGGHDLESSPVRSKGLTRPVENVSWHDIKLFISLLHHLLHNEKLFAGNQVIKLKGGFNLPSEIQWEYAARAGGAFLFAGSNQVQDVAWYDGNNDLHTMPVGLKKPNAWGLFDMSGNVYEWCANNSNELPEHGEAGDMDQDNTVSLRGGGCWDGARSCWVRNRYFIRPDRRIRLIGFRLLFSPSSSTA